MEKLCVIGLGYVGLPLAVEFAEKYPVIGYDIDAKRIQELQAGVDRTLEITSERLKKNSIRYTSQLEKIGKCNIYIITVPTPIDRDKNPDLSILLKASEDVGRVLKQGDLVIYESTVYPGCTEEDCVPVLEKVSGLKFNQDFFCGYSPERINPGDKSKTIRDIVKVTSGSTPEVADRVDALYRSIINAGTHKTSSMRVAEASKVVENTQRDLNIAFANELAMMFEKMGINTHEVLKAAGTKWNFMKVVPGLVGGQCIGVNPYFLSHQAQKHGYTSKLIPMARAINDQMPAYVASQVIKQMIKKGIEVKGARILVLGITFKPNCPDVRNSKVLDLIRELEDYECVVEVYDPYFLEEDKKIIDNHILNVLNEKSLLRYQIVVCATKHDSLQSLEIDISDYYSFEPKL
ncbi:nucleotide sugar dehydrogenase [Peredibacter starrii]|uniref:Nucleotide sugar dehydrogenase n=1 Tax=Peredibacter starrii TaxID=28202 RepID=A0AAX4HRK5_9BACT|nr:nucleotide sugar dehydrogenase [Peredibacter starrii]WPU65817.1 nucleotide sugar dehydrogenase [Peredibacter starrii]